MQCDCGAFYVGKTKRAFFQRIRDHVSLIFKKRLKTPISQHMGLYHNFDLSHIHFFALDHAPNDKRGGDVDRLLLQW